MFFFSQKNCLRKCFFFSQEKFEPYTHTQFQRAEKKNRSGKKTPFLLTHTIFSKKWSFLNFSRGEKNTVPLVQSGLGLGRVLKFKYGTRSGLFETVKLLYPPRDMRSIPKVVQLFIFMCYPPKGDPRAYPVGSICFKLYLSKRTSRRGLFETLKIFYPPKGDAEHIS